jgi:hypothetical protein
MFFKNRLRRRVIVEIVFNKAYSGLDTDAILKRFPILSKWKDGIPLDQATKIINEVSYILKDEIEGKTACKPDIQVYDSFQISLQLNDNEIKTKKVSIAGLIGTLSDTANATKKIFK